MPKLGLRSMPKHHLTLHMLQRLVPGLLGLKCARCHLHPDCFDDVSMTFEKIHGCFDEVFWKFMVVSMTFEELHGCFDDV